MLWTPRHAGKLSYGQTELIHVIRRCGLTSGLKLCLDAGDAASYASGQSWLDLSGNGHDFFRGITSGSEASDPTFNGTAGKRSSGEYWSFDGGDFFRYDTTNETWMQNLHKDNAKFTLISWLQTVNIPSSYVVIMGDTGGGGPGIQWYITSPSRTLGLGVGYPTSVLSVASSLSVPTSVWSMCALSLDEAVGASGGFFYLNGAQETFTSTYTTPYATAAQYVMNLAAVGDAANIFRSGSRMGMFAAWESVALTKTQLDAFYMATRGRFGA